MKIETGKYYRRRDGQVCGPMKLDCQYAEVWAVCYHFKKDGRHAYGQRELDLISEVAVTDVLPFELKAGEKYHTEWVDGGLPGPVLTLRRCMFVERGLVDCAPFIADSEPRRYITADGRAVQAESGRWDIRITSPYTEPKPPTIAERLERQIEAAIRSPEMDALIAEIRKLEGGAK